MADVPQAMILAVRCRSQEWSLTGSPELCRSLGSESAGAGPLRGVQWLYAWSASSAKRLAASRLPILRTVAMAARCLARGLDSPRSHL